MADSNSKIGFQQDFSKHNVFQHALGARPVSDSVRIINGQLALVTDCSFGVGLDVALRSLAEKFYRSGYSFGLLKRGVSKFTSRYPYLFNILNGHFLHVDGLHDDYSGRPLA